MSLSTANVNVSLESHLVSALEPLLTICDSSLASQLAQHLTQPIIPYSVLHSVSQWARSPAGFSALQTSTPPLDPNSYTMIALLAGSTTSPERKFAPYVPPQEPEQIMNQKKRERKAITTIINGVLSVIGSGAAAWLGSEKTSWKQEWRLLFALFVAVIVAISETVLYIIWQSRSTLSKPTRRKYIRGKKQDSDPDTTSPVKDKTDNQPDGGLRLRIHATNKD